jgi:hypothetical protein
MSPIFTRRIEPSADALVRQVRARTQAAPAGVTAAVAPAPVATPVATPVTEARR